MNYYNTAISLTNLAAGNYYRTNHHSSLFAAADALGIDMPDALVKTLKEIGKAQKAFTEFSHTQHSALTFDDLVSPRAQDTLAATVALRVNVQEAHRVTAEVNTAIGGEFMRAVYEAVPYYYGQVEALALENQDLREYMFVVAPEHPGTLREKAMLWTRLAQLHTALRGVEEPDRDDKVPFGGVLAFIDWPTDEWLEYHDENRINRTIADPWKWAHERGYPISVTKSHAETLTRYRQLAEALDAHEAEREKARMQPGLVRGVR
ncbi:hypothetical protein EZE58_02540 [Brevibacterium sp. LS14]|uniref:hypothetical protein n=1 Tax=Brevibacterium sp. LS14 TaxID=2528962 RepID=UPI0014307421|nr:hypothetical protein [Brevibacterium sp. LS14]